jgi:hypothetical protein
MAAESRRGVSVSRIPLLCASGSNRLPSTAPLPKVKAPPPRFLIPTAASSPGEVQLVCACGSPVVEPPPTAKFREKTPL